MKHVIVTMLLIGRLLCLSLVGGSSATADDWPQWRGLHRDGVWHEPGILTKIPEQGLPIKWKALVKMAYSGPAVADGQVFVTDYVVESGDAANDGITRSELTGNERILCFNATIGWHGRQPCAARVFVLLVCFLPSLLPTSHFDDV